MVEFICNLEKALIAIKVLALLVLLLIQNFLFRFCFNILFEEGGRFKEINYKVNSMKKGNLLE